MKIGRLGVCVDSKGKGLGKIIVNFIIDIAIFQNEVSAYKLITVDAYRESLPFYGKMEFSYLTETDAGKDTRQMYLDLTPILNAAS